MRSRLSILPLALGALSACGTVKARSGDAGNDARSAQVDGGHVAQGHVDVLTQHNDSARTGQNLNETVLTQSNVNAAAFGKLMTLPVDGQMYAQPLVVTDVMVNGSPHDLLIVATMHNSVYAFDANTGAQLWKVNLGPSVPSTAIGPIVAKTGMPQGTLNIRVEVGIVATPVIDRANGYIYLTRKDYTNSVQSYVAHVLSLTTGMDEAGSPVTLNAQVAGPDGYDAGTDAFDAAWQLQRPGLLLLNGTVYMAFASHEDFQPYHGWILGYTYSASAGTYTQTQVFNVTPDGTEGGIWMSGQGLASDGTSIYPLTSNGSVTVQLGGKSYGEAFLKLTPDLEVQDWFIPNEWEDMNEGDWDLGAGGPLLIPGTSPQLIVGGGKEGKLYVVNTTNMGHLAPKTDLNTQEFFVHDGGNARNGLGNIYGAPIVWSGNGTPRLFVWPSGDVIKGYDLHDGLFDTNPIAGPTALSNVVSPMQDPVGSLSVSSNGSTSGTGIVWATRPSMNPDHQPVPGTFYAFDADTLTELWGSNQNPARDAMGYYAKFVPPTVANGKVYLANWAELGSTTPASILVYGLLSSGQSSDASVDAGTDATMTTSHDAAADVTDAATTKDAPAPPPPFSLEAGVTWQALYRDYFGPGGRASCQGDGHCHGGTSEVGFLGSGFLCPASDAGAACFMSITSTGDDSADLITPDASFTSDEISSVLCQDNATVGQMPTGGDLGNGCAYSFTTVDIQRIADWIAAGASEN